MTTKKRKTRKTQRAHRESTLPVGVGERVLDKLLLMEEIIGRDEVLQVLRDTDCLDQRRCTLTFEVTFWIVLVMGLCTDLPYRLLFKYARRLWPGEDTPHRSSLCKARQRLGVAPLRLLFERLARSLATPQTPGAFYQGWRLVAMDGTVFNVPDSQANADAFGYPQGGRGQGAFPQVRKLSLIEAGTHAELALVVKGLKEKNSGEQALAPALFRHLRADMLLLWDRGFFSYKLWQELVLRNCQLLARVQARLVLRPFEFLADGSYLAKLYPCESLRNRDEGGVVVRVIRYSHNDPRRVGCGSAHVLLTTLRDAVRYPAKELIVQYHERWEIENTLDEQKTHQTPWRVTKPAHLRSETPLGVLQEIYALAVVHWVVRQQMARAAQTVGLDPDRLSFVGCLQILRCRMSECPQGAEACANWYLALVDEWSKERTEPRRPRLNPRVIRVKMSKFKKKRPEHRHLPPSERSFKEVIVMQLVEQT